MNRQTVVNVQQRLRQYRRLLETAAGELVDDFIGDPEALTHGDPRVSAAEDLSVAIDAVSHALDRFTS